MIDDFLELGVAEPMAVERCDRTVIEIQVSGHSTREKVETDLSNTVEYGESTGWRWKPAPIESHNVYVATGPTTARYLRSGGSRCKRIFLGFRSIRLCSTFSRRSRRHTSARRFHECLLGAVEYAVALAIH